MIQKSGQSEAAKAYGKILPSPIVYDYSYSAYESKAEIDAANDNLSDEEIVAARNSERQINARQKALQAALDAAGIQRPTIDTDEQLRLRDMFKVLMSSKRYTEEQARELAASTLGLVWEK